MLSAISLEYPFMMAGGYVPIVVDLIFKMTWDVSTGVLQLLFMGVTHLVQSRPFFGIPPGGEVSGRGVDSTCQIIKKGRCRG